MLRLCKTDRRGAVRESLERMYGPRRFETEWRTRFGSSSSKAKRFPTAKLRRQLARLRDRHSGSVERRQAGCEHDADRWRSQAEKAETDSSRHQRVPLAAANPDATSPRRRRRELASTRENHVPPFFLTHHHPRSFAHSSPRDCSGTTTTTSASSTHSAIGGLVGSEYAGAQIPSRHADRQQRRRPPPREISSSTKPAASSSSVLARARSSDAYSRCAEISSTAAALPTAAAAAAAPCAQFGSTRKRLRSFRRRGDASDRVGGGPSPAKDAAARIWRSARYATKCD